MSKKFLWIVAFVFSFALSQTVLADSWGCGKGLREMVESLKLDDTQKAKITPILDQLKSSLKDNWSQLPDVDTQIHQQEFSANLDQSTVDALVDKKTKLLGNMMKAKITAKNQILTVLTTQQKTELQNKMKDVEDKITEKFKSCHDQD